MKKLVSILVCAVMLFTCSSVVLAINEDNTESDSWIFSNGSIIGYTDNTVTELVIPETIDGITVNSIGGNAFEDFKNLERITFPSTLERVEYAAFKNCEKLESLDFPEGFRYIGYEALEGCSGIRSITIPSTTTSISDSLDDCVNLEGVYVDENNENYSSENGILFNKEKTELIRYPSMTTGTYTVGDSIEYVSQYAFSGSHLTHLIIPNTVQEMSGVIGATYLQNLTLPDNQRSISVSGCDNLLNIYIDENNKNFQSIDGVVFNKSGKELKKVPTGRTEYEIPDTVSIIGQGAFESCKKITEINIPNNIREIGAYAFSRCENLRDISFSNNLKIIGGYAFQHCTSLEEIIIPDGVQEIYYSAFSYCTALKRAVFPDNVDTVYSGIFSGCSALEECVLPSNIKHLASMFYGCSSLESIKIPDSLESIGSQAFSDCTSLKSIDLPVGVSQISSNAFKNCVNLETIDLSNITSIDKEAFSGCIKLEDITLSDKLESIGLNAFSNCENFENITIPKNTTNIEFPIFSGCSKLTEINIDSNNPAYLAEDGIVFNKDKTTIFECITQKNGVYEVPDTITEIADGAFADTMIEEVKIPESVTEIKSETFKNCEQLSTIVLPDTFEIIGERAFENCKALEYIDIPDSVVDIGDYAFRNTGIKEITIPEGIEYTGFYTFYEASGLETVHLPDTLTEINDGAFSGCSSLKNINIPNNLVQIGASAFAYCTSLEEVIFPANFRSITTGGFIGCSNLKKATFLGFSWMGADVFDSTPVILYGYDGTGVQRMAQSEGVPYVVIEPEINEITAVMNNDNISVTVDSYFTQDAELMAVSYKDGAAVDADKLLSGQATLQGDADNVKVFCWKSLESMIPLCPTGEAEVQ